MLFLFIGTNKYILVFICVEFFFKVAYCNASNSLNFLLKLSEGFARDNIIKRDLN